MPEVLKLAGRGINRVDHYQQTIEISYILADCYFVGKRFLFIPINKVLNFFTGAILEKVCPEEGKCLLLDGWVK